MRIYFPRDMLSEKVLRGFEEMGYKIVDSNGEFVVFKGVFSLNIRATSIDLGHRKFVQLSRMIKVEGGRKRRLGATLIIEPRRNKRLAVRLSSDEYEALVKVAECRGFTKRNLTSFFRDTLLLSLSTRLEKMGVM
ncbi:hypothetical protein [Thermofilum sp.]|uniref:hypothetical protein n=1 Tax=Thermofilum sp. TaxID=1961369 RepID=UPI003164B799